MTGARVDHGIRKRSTFQRRIARAEIAKSRVQIAYNREQIGTEEYVKLMRQLNDRIRRLRNADKIL